MDPVGQTVWNFTDAIAPDRATRLLSWQLFDDIVDALSTCGIASLYWEEAIAPRLRGCSRASFELTVPHEVYDAFFNAPVGYRGQRARSEGHGERANRTLLSALFSRLIQVAASHPTASLESVTTSLHGQQAKVWIDETEVQGQLSDPTPHIVFPAWEFNEPDGPGLRAPLGTILSVKGGWVSATGGEVINAAKTGEAVTSTGPVIQNEA